MAKIIQRKRVARSLGHTLLAVGALMVLGFGWMFFHALSHTGADLLLDPASGDAKLVAALKDLRAKARTDQRDLSPDRTTLADALRQSHLSARSLVDIGRNLHIETADDTSTALVYQAAVRRGHEELRRHPRGAFAEVRPTVAALNTMRGLLWKVVDSGDKRFLDDIYQLDCDLMRWIGPDDTELQDAKVRACIGAAGCLDLKGNASEAIALLQGLNEEQLTDDQRVRLCWIRGLALWELERYADAAVDLKRVAANGRYKHRKDALPALVLSYTRIGQFAEARAACRELQAAYPDSPLIPHVAAELREATRSEQ
jgi:tetratricopeptide (TPR) repeat protein